MVEFKADKVRISGPKVDGTWSVTFECGEYEKYNVAKLMGLQDNDIITVKVEQNDTR